MVKLELEIPDELEKEIKEFSEDWSRIALEAIKLKIFEFELKRSRKLRHLLFKALISKSKFSEKDALELGRKINESPV
ncbi:MAG: hypothetical protein DRP10_03580 [Candidatus Aenigmatarchaeota archaeon]|nr:MAG: hypothetical protein DRP10_03580 [Candidatus Aenigmarchaeota archaeon]